MCKLMNELEKNFFEKPIVDLAVDYLDIGLDMITDSEILENIPVVKTFIAICKTGMSIKDRFFAKKLMIFSYQINTDNISDSELKKRKKAIENHEKWIEREIEEIITFLDKFDFAYKAQILAKLYVAFVNGVISSDKYLNMLPIIDKWQKYDNMALKTVYTESKKHSLNISDANKDYVTSIDFASKQRLEALGVLGIQRNVKTIFEEIDFKEMKGSKIDEIMEERNQYYLCEEFMLTYEGIILSEILFEDNVKTQFNKDYFNLSFI